jgi:Ubiquitin-like modifier-activating enzyme ATG7 N-terminus
MFFFDCLRRFGCPSLLPKIPFTSTLPVRLRDVGTMGCSDSTSNMVPVAGKEGTHTHSTPDGTSSSSSSSVGSINGIVSMYHGLVNKDFWLTEENSTSGSGGAGGQGGGEGQGQGEVPAGSTGAGTGRSDPPKGLPPVFALVRTPRSLKQWQDNAEMKEKSRGDEDVSTSSAVTEDTHDWKVTSLSAAWDDRYSSDTYIVCADTSSSSTALGWGVRNVLALLATHLPATETSQGDDEGDGKETSNSSSSSSPVPDAHTDSASGSRASCNIIALRGVLAKRLHKCASREKAKALLDTLTDSQLGLTVQIY